MTITFNTKGHDGFIDFIKAYAILCVIFGHTFLWLDKVGYAIWGGMQVPLFILVQTFHSYKKDDSTVRLDRIFKRVLLPFFIIEILTAGFALLLNKYDCNYLINRIFEGGGYGPGAYYPWIYLQLAILLPCFSTPLRKLNKWVSLAAFLVACEGFEFLFSVIDLSENVYRLLAVRYLFLIMLGWIWAKDGIKVNWFTITLSILSLIAIIYFEYISDNDEPFFFNTNWKYHRWPCYFFVANGFTGFLYFIWNQIKELKCITTSVNYLASASYEIFLIQMSVIFLFNYNDLTFFPNTILMYIVWVVLVWVLSLTGGLLLHHLIKGEKAQQ